MLYFKRPTLRRAGFLHSRNADAGRSQRAAAQGPGPPPQPRTKARAAPTHRSPLRVSFTAALRSRYPLPAPGSVYRPPVPSTDAGAGRLGVLVSQSDQCPPAEVHLRLRVAQGSSQSTDRFAEAAAQPAVSKSECAAAIRVTVPGIAHCRSGRHLDQAAERSDLSRWFTLHAVFSAADGRQECSRGAPTHHTKVVGSGCYNCVEDFGRILDQPGRATLTCGHLAWCPLAPPIQI